MTDRDVEKTKAKILDSLSALLAEEGFGALGINAVARRAGVDKVLIYRYFGGMSELLRTYASSADFWPSISQLSGESLSESAGLNLREISARLLKGHLRELLRRPRTQEIMRWELLKRNELSDELARAREQQGLEIMQLLGSLEGIRSEVDLAAVAALLHAGLSYLVLRANTADDYIGVHLNSDEGRRRIEGAVDIVIDAVFRCHIDKGQPEEE